jgi:hypothetical protein
MAEPTGVYALGTRNTLKNLEWIYEHTEGRKADGTASDVTRETARSSRRSCGT